jgi:histidinol-phosphatase (PHP family)
MKNIIDCHSHSSNSPDADESVEVMCDRAVSLGLLAYGISDHFESNHTNDFYKNASRNSFLEIDNYRKNYNPSTKILAGIELGQPLQNINISEEIIKAYDFDFIIGSLHNLNLKKDFAFFEYKESEVNELLFDYFDELLDVVKWGKFNVLGHLTYPLRYITGKFKISIDMSVFKNQIDAILQEIIKKDIALEINTSTLRGELKDTLPGLEQVNRYVELGGKLITVGADAHNSVYIAYGIQNAYEMIKKAGLSQVCYFEKQKAQFVQI